MSNIDWSNGSQHVTLVLAGMSEAIKFWATASAANEMFSKFRRVINGTDPPGQFFFIDVEFGDGTIERHAIPMSQVCFMSTIPSGPSQEADAIKRLADIAEREAKRGDEWRDDDAE